MFQNKDFTSKKQWRFTMQQDKLGQYYNIDFEKIININDLFMIMEITFPMYNFSIQYNQDIYEKTYNTNIDTFHIWITIQDLKEDDIYYFEDIKLRTLFYISNECSFDKNQIIKFCNDLSQKLDSKIYISMEDIEENTFSLNYCSVWCIDNNKMRIMFDAQEFFDDYPSQ
ncbi:hypothetical protein [Alysiella crassa]|nr:hypothetical protein [Alysiella crassa]